jgi:ABC-type bacteriocin/lantibiotic exporter with double-glycine peptidase domain
MTIKETTDREQFIKCHTLLWFGTAIMGSLFLATILTSSWTLFWIALLAGVAYMLMLTLPVFIAILSGNAEVEE